MKLLSKLIYVNDKGRRPFMRYVPQIRQNKKAPIGKKPLNALKTLLTLIA